MFFDKTGADKMRRWAIVMALGGLAVSAFAADAPFPNRPVRMFVRGTLQHASYPGIVTTAGNMAYPFSPFGVPVGPAYRFAVYHLMPLDDPRECFPMTIEEVRN